MNPGSSSRRAFLVGVGAIGAIGLVGACTSNAPEPITLETDPVTPSDPQIASELQLIALYAAVTRSFPELAPILTPIATQHEEHARALGYGLDIPATEIDAAPTSRQALRSLINAEEQATRERLDACSTASDPAMARLLTLIAASEASHVIELESRTSGQS